MASLQQIQSRRKAVKNVGQITKAMEVVAATKMRKSQDAALRSRPYAQKVFELLDRMLEFAPVTSDLAKPNGAEGTLVVIMTSDRGLIGAFNTQVLREAEKFSDATIVTVGRKATAYAGKRGMTIAKSFEGFGEFALPSETDELNNFLVEGYLEKKWGKVVMIYTHFQSTLKQVVKVENLLPLTLPTTHYTLSTSDYIFEPNPEEAINALMPHLLRMKIYDFILEANASEHSARMVAMKNASDNATELTEDLTLIYNKARQANITREIIEITSAQI
ncbi:MAG: ATP synthase F1 subunit gamma [Patescibacteria group bacterium]